MSLATSLLILYIGLSLMCGIIIFNKRTNIFSDDEDIKNYPFKLYTMTFLCGIVCILYFIEGNILLGCLMLISFILDIKKKF